MIITLQKVRPKSALKSARPGGDGKNTEIHGLYPHTYYIYIRVCVYDIYVCMCIYIWAKYPTLGHMYIYIYVNQQMMVDYIVVELKKQ